MKDTKEMETPLFPDEYGYTMKTERNRSLKDWLLVIIFSALSGLLASSIGFYYMFAILYK